MPHEYSPIELEFIEEVAQERVKFNRIFKEQSAILRTNVPEYLKAMQRFEQSGNIAKRWAPPSPEKVNESRYDELCKAVPINFDE
jgi:hypothetical protein